MSTLLKRFKSTIMSQPLWGIDLGGTKTEGVILHSIHQPAPITRLRIDTHKEKGYDHILDNICLLIDKMSEETGLVPQRVGIGTPGIKDPVTQTMINCNTTALNGRPLQQDLEARLGIPVLLANDANCFALAETQWGVVKQAYPKARIVFGIIMGTGVGGAIIIDEKVWAGRHGIAGEWGHNFLHESGGPCYCGKIGCVETVLSGPALENYYLKKSGNRLPLKDIVCMNILRHDQHAQDTVDRMHEFFGKGVASVINLLDPDIIVVGGGVGNIESLYGEGINRIKQYIFNTRLNTKIVKPVLGDSAGVFGAAALGIIH
jgi:predicted NBD/HSP70 family sugar kinase